MPRAKNLTERVSHDPQMALPAYPCLSEDLIKLWHNQRCLVIGGGVEDVVLRGRSVESMLPQLLPLLRGKLTIDEITARIEGFRPQAAIDSLYLLFMQGVLEDGRAGLEALQPDQIKAFQSQLKFYSRYIDHTRALHGRYEVLARLQASSLLVCGQGAAARQALAEIAALGVGRAVVVALDAQPAAWQELAGPYFRVELVEQPTERAAWRELVEEQDLLLLLTDTAAPSLTRHLNQLSVETHIPFLRAHISPAQVDIGPTVFADQSGCYECAHLMGLLDLDAPEAPAAPVAWDGLSPEEHIGISQTALFVLSNLTKLTPIRTGDAMFRLNRELLMMERHAVYNLVGCPVCSQVEGYQQWRTLAVGPRHSENWPALFHFNTNDKPYNMFPKGHQQHYRASNMKAVSGAYKQYAAQARLPLPTRQAAPEVFQAPFAEVSAESLPPSDRPFTIDDLAFFLQLVAGRYLMPKDEDFLVGLRVTPSAGGMASQTLYFANFAVPGLAPGIYHFNPNGYFEELAAGQWRAQFDNALIGAEELSADVLGAIVVTEAFGRVEAKYLNKAYRYTYFDSGAMWHSLHTVGRLLGVDIWLASNFYDDNVHELLNLHSPTEYAAYVAYLL